MKSVVEINERDRPAFQKATQKSYAKYSKSFGDDWLKLVEAAR
jgi:hypothetical protein